jgi:hypothetical protein
MAFSPSTITELYQELAYHQRKAAMINQLLADMPPSKGRARQPRRSSRRRPRQTPEAGPNGTFRGALRQLIRDRPGITRAGLIDLLKTAGFRAEKDTVMNARVYNELWHMVRGGQIERTFDGGYTIKQAA